jgi:hypothetical protein
MSLFLKKKKVLFQRASKKEYTGSEFDMREGTRREYENCV